MEDNCSLPSLQDMLEDFDASRLEELAESLLADVTTEFEDDATKSGHRTTQTQGKSKSMLGSMVGTKTKQLESSKDINGSLRTPTHQPTIDNIKQEIIDCLPCDDDMMHGTADAPNTPANQSQQIQNQFDHAPFNHNEQMFDVVKHNNNNISKIVATNATTTNHISNIDKSMILRNHTKSDGTDKKVIYETTYDDDGNLIAVILSDEDISNFEEVIEDTTNQEEEDECMSHASALSPIPSANYASPGYSVLSADDPATASDHDSAYDSAINSPPGKISSAWSTTSSVNCMDDDDQYYDYWAQDSLSMLFPSLA